MKALNKFPSHPDKPILLKDDVLCACNKMYTPICGSDGVTYNNLCILKCHQKVTPDLKGVRFGRCEDQNLEEQSTCVCNKMLLPVCGSDGVTYNNPCLLRCQQKKNSTLTMVRYGICTGTVKTEVAPKYQPVCPLLWAPVCGSDGKTYANMCLFKYGQSHESDLSVVHYGVCGQVQGEVALMFQPVCPELWAPVCGSDGKTYANMCLFKYSQSHESGLSAVHYGVCGQVKEEVVPKFQPVCPELWAPVCGSDGKTYANMCLLKYGQSHESGLSVVHYGVCGEIKEEVAPKYQPVCPEIWAPVCGSDGKTYANMCLLKYSQSHESGLSVVHYGVCGQVQEEAAAKFQPVCPELWAPVCGNDAKTYANMCLFKYSQSHQPELTVAYQGACYEGVVCVCTRERNPVCGTDGKTYGNPCTFKCQEHIDKRLQVAHMGEC